MAFREILEELRLPEGASERFRRLSGLERMLAGTFYDDLRYAFEKEKDDNGTHIMMRHRRPSIQFNLAYEIVSDTQAELFGDEQFPTIRSVKGGDVDDDATNALAELLAETELDDVVHDAYLDGVVGGVGVVLEAEPDGTPHYEVLPAKYCEPIYRRSGSSDLVALVVTYPIDPEEAETIVPGITGLPENKAVETYWHRYVVGPRVTIQYVPLPDAKFAHLGETGDNGDVIEFEQLREYEHGFGGRTPAIYAKNLGGRRRDIDGIALWWPAVDACIALDYNLSQVDRGLRYSADPMLFLKRGDLASAADYPMGFDGPGGGMAKTLGADGAMVKGVTQTFVGGKDSDAKLIEMNGNGISEEREFVHDLREYVLEVIGGMKARAEHVKGAASGRAIDKQGKPLRRLVRRQRRPYGDGLLIGLLELTLYGIRRGVLRSDVDVDVIPIDAKHVLDWPNDETLQGKDLLDHVTGMQLAAGGSAVAPIQLIAPDAIGSKLVGDIGLHEPYDAVKGSGLLPEPPAPAATPPSQT